MSNARDLLEGSGDNVYWKDIPPGAIVIDKGNLWTTGDGSVIYWEGKDAAEAHAALTEWAKAGKRPQVERSGKVSRGLKNFGDSRGSFESITFNSERSVSEALPESRSSQSILGVDSEPDPDWEALDRSDLARAGIVYARDGCYAKKSEKGYELYRPSRSGTHAEACGFVGYKTSNPERRMREEVDRLAARRLSVESRSLGEASANELDAFTRAYIEALLWSENDESDEQGGDPLDKNYGVEDFSPEALQAIVADCKKFQTDNADAISVGASRGGGKYTPQEQAGHDFLLTRNSHGEGFWSGDWPEPQATQLTKASEAFGAVYVYVGDDGLIHQSGSEKPHEPKAGGGELLKGDESGGLGEAARAAVDRLIEGDSPEHNDDSEAKPEDVEAEEEDYSQMVSDIQNGECGLIDSSGNVMFCDKRLGVVGRDFETDVEAFAALRAEAEKRKFWPSVYTINDHGNVTLYGLDGKSIKDWV